MGELYGDWYADSQLIPEADPEDLKSAWFMREEHNFGQSTRDSFQQPRMDYFQRARSRGANVWSVQMRLLQWESITEEAKITKLTLPGMQDGKPADAVFRVLAVVPMFSGGMYQGTLCPLIEKELGQ